MPRKPIDPNFSHISEGKAFALSISWARGANSFCAKSRATSWSLLISECVERGILLASDHPKECETHKRSGKIAQVSNYTSLNINIKLIHTVERRSCRNASIDDHANSYKSLTNHIY